MMGDTQDYLTLASHRPPLYGWLLAAYQWATGGLDYLPLFQFALIMASLLFLSIELGWLLRSAFAGAIIIPLILHHVGIYDTVPIVQSEGLFLTTIMAGLALQCRYARIGGVVKVLGAAICFALAAATRTTGAAFLLLPLLTSLLDRRVGLRSAVLRAGLSAGACGVVLLMAMAGNWAQHGRFEVGSWTGGSALGKALLLLEPADLPGLPPAVSVAVPAAAELRRLIAEQPDLAARMRAQMQAFQDLRFAIFFPAAEESWPEWAAADQRGRSQLGLGIWRRIAARHPVEYLELWARDWGSLVLFPMHWPAWATTEPADPNAFAACRLHGNCWTLTRFEIPLRALMVMLIASLAGCVGGVVMLLATTGRVLRRRAGPVLVQMWASALVMQLSLLVTAAFEAGLMRYTVALHVLGLTMLLWFIVAAVRAIAARRPRAAHRPAADDRRVAAAVTVPPSAGQSYRRGVQGG